MGAVGAGSEGERSKRAARSLNPEIPSSSEDEAEEMGAGGRSVPKAEADDKSEEVVPGSATAEASRSSRWSRLGADLEPTWSRRWELTAPWEASKR